MNRGAIPTLFVAAGLVGGGGSPAEAKRTSCQKPGVTRLKSSVARVYETRSGRVHVCHLHTGRRFLVTRTREPLDSPDQVSGFVRPRLSGRYLAFGDEFSCDRVYGDCSARVRVVDVTSGRNKHAVTSFIPRGTRESPPSPRLPALQLKPNGSAAFILGPDADAAWAVWKLDPDGDTRLDAGNLDPHSLATNRTRIYWTRDGVPSSARWR